MKATSSEEEQIVKAFILSATFLARIRPRFRPELFGCPEWGIVASWCIEFWEQHKGAPGTNHLDQVYLKQVDALPKDQADFIEMLLTATAERYGKEPRTDYNSDFAYTEAVKYFDRREVETASEAATDAALRGDYSRVRREGWRLATLGVSAEKLADPWGDPEPPPFDVGILPPVLSQFAVAQAKAIGVEAAAVAWMALAACSGALDASTRLHMKKTDLSFTVPPGVWCLLVTDASGRKSPILKAAFAPLVKLQAQRAERWLREMAEWKSHDPETRGEQPTFEQLYTNDTTPEGLRDTLVTQDRGIVSLNDEWSRHVGAMGRYAGGKDAGAADRAFYNSAFDGGPHISNRAGRKGAERIAIRNLQTTVVGCVTIELLRAMNKGGGLTADGMLQRSCPILLGRHRLGADVDTAGVAAHFGRLIRRLVELPGGRRLSLTDEADVVRARIEERLLPYERIDSLGMGFATAIGKLYGIWGRIAMTLACVLKPRDETTEVGKDAAELAERLVFESLIPNMILFYRDVLGGGGADTETTRSIASFLLRKERLRVAAREIQSGVHAMKQSGVDKVRDAVSPLVTMGWITPDGNDERRTSNWEVNPVIYSQFAERRAEEVARTALLRETMTAAFDERRSRKQQNKQSGEDEQSGDDDAYFAACKRERKSSDPNNFNSEEDVTADAADASVRTCKPQNKQRWRDKVLAASMRDPVRDREGRKEHI